MDQCRELAAWAEALPIVPVEPVSEVALIKNLRIMQATLPARATDDDTGERRTAVHIAILRDYSTAAIKYLTARACRELRWFPTPKECLDILADYRAPESERSATLRFCARFAQDAFDQWIANVAAGQELGDVPEQWLRIAVERGHARRLQDGSFVSRARFVGPMIRVGAMGADAIGSAA